MKPRQPVLAKSRIGPVLPVAVAAERHINKPVLLWNCEPRHSSKRLPGQDSKQSNRPQPFANTVPCPAAGMYAASLRHVHCALHGAGSRSILHCLGLESATMTGISALDTCQSLAYGSSSNFGTKSACQAMPELHSPKLIYAWPRRSKYPILEASGSQALSSL